MYSKFLEYLMMLKKQSTYMVKYALIIIFTLVYSCVTSNKKSEKEIVRCNVVTKIPEKIIENHGEMLVIDFFVSYYNQYVLYELPYHKTYEIDNKLIYDSLKYEFFIYNSNNEYGYCLKNQNDSFVLRVNKDSVLKARAYGGNVEIEAIFKEVKIKSLNNLNNDGQTCIYKYEFDNDFYDSAYFHYDTALKEIRFSLSKSFDSANNSKLYKVQLFLKQDRSAAALNLKDFYINSFEIRKAKSKNEIVLKRLFDRFIKEEKVNHFK